MLPGAPVRHRANVSLLGCKVLHTRKQGELAWQLDRADAVKAQM